MPGNVISGTLRGGLFTRSVGKRILFFQETSSTMDEAARLAQEGAEEGTVVVAETQTAGRGRQGRNWVSQQGNLYLSVVFRPTLGTLPMLSILSGLAAARAVRKTTGLDARIKWPNDIMIARKKVGGILAESVVEGDRIAYAVVGIGINVSLDAGNNEEIASLATALNAEAGRDIAPEDVLRQLLHDLDNLYLGAAQGISPLGEWTGLLDTLGQRVEAGWGDEIYTGLAEGVDELGNLRLRLDSGDLLTLTSGDATLHDYPVSNH